MKPFGFALTFGDYESKCASLTTGAQPDGTYEFFVHLLAGPGVERHLHGYAEVGSEGTILKGGSRLKEDVGAHVGPGLSLTESTQEIARFVVKREADGIRTQLLQCVDNSWLGTSDSTGEGPITRRPVILPGSQRAHGAEYSLAMFDATATSVADSSITTRLPFSSPTPFGVSVSLVKRW